MNIGGEEGSSNSPEPIPEADLATFLSGISAWTPESSHPQPCYRIPLLASRRHLPCVRKGGIAIAIARRCPRARENSGRAFAESSGAAADLAGCAAMDIVLILARQRQDLWDLVIEAEVWRVDATPATHSPPWHLHSGVDLGGFYTCGACAEPVNPDCPFSIQLRGISTGGQEVAGPLRDLPVPGVAIAATLPAAGSR